MRKRSIVKVYYILFAAFVMLLQAASCMSQQREYRITGGDRDGYVPVYFKNNIPMLPATAIELIVGEMPPLEIKNKKVKLAGGIYKLIQEPDFTDSTIYISADFFPKAMFTSLCFDFAGHTIKVNYNVMEDDRTLFLKKGDLFAIDIYKESEEDIAWQYIVSSKKAITLTEKMFIATVGVHTRHSWGNRPNSQTGEMEYYEEDTYEPSKSGEQYMFRADKKGDFMLIFRSDKGVEKKFRIVITD